MRRLIVFVTLLVLAMPFAASAAVRAPGDGTLSVRDLDGSPTGISVWIKVPTQGALVGRCDQCAFRLDDLKPDDAGIPIVTGYEKKLDVDGDGEREFYSGRDIQWKIVGGGFWLRIRQGRDIDLSVVGKGLVRVRGTAGTYSVNGAEPLAVPPDFARFWLSAATPPK
jgi:hypothetical protein